ncbi:hypothetical protein BBP40_004642 [Aspergillus hancockii]|nr:hypothetical protein BBP40_004642 [Aspergillus hancockii]
MAGTKKRKNNRRRQPSPDPSGQSVQRNRQPGPNWANAYTVITGFMINLMSTNISSLRAVSSQLYFGTGKSEDPDIHVDLYGLSPNIVHRIYFDPTTVLNKHATIAANERKQAQAKELRPYFDSFIKLLKKSEFSSSNLDGLPSSLTLPYFRFWKVADKL